jgi:hypothetical protein
MAIATREVKLDEFRTKYAMKLQRIQKLLKSTLSSDEKRPENYKI